MIGKLAAFVLLSSASLFHTAELLQPLSLTVAEVGASVTLTCPVTDKEGKFFNWYKQPLGYTAQKIVAGILGKITISAEFKSHFIVTKGDDHYHLTIANVSKADEAVYFCQNGTAYALSVVNSTFLAVNDQNLQENVYVKQSLSMESGRPGDSVTLQCSLLSKNKESRVQCPGERDVHWFRAGPQGFNPGVVYTHWNSDDGGEDRSCVYSLSKTIQDASDAGTYYCAVATCGHILFGEGTKVETRPGLDPVVLVLGVLLSCCVTVIGALIVCLRRREVCEHCQGERRATEGGSNDGLVPAEEVKYAALDFSTKNAPRAQMMAECVYAAVERS